MRKGSVRQTRWALCSLVLLTLVACVDKRERPSAYQASGIHPEGILDPASADFHGVLLKSLHWDFSACEKCHGDNLDGGLAQVSCTGSCHSAGPQACETCHQDILAHGAHGRHVGSTQGIADFAGCQTCHTTPGAYTDVGHILNQDGSVDESPAEVHLGVLANMDSDYSMRTGPAHYDTESNTCSQVYCHGGVYLDNKALHSEPNWFELTVVNCSNCHGSPPANHAQSDCVLCHQQVFDAQGGFIDGLLHRDAVVQLGEQGDTSCKGCHGMDDTGAPPRDLLGNTATTFIGVGAHQSHLQAPHGISAPIQCVECHKPVTALQSSGHIDTPWPAEVFANTGAVLATAAGAQPSWDRDSARCADVYCHGGGALSTDTAPGINRTPLWTSVANGEVYCGSCHGIPPEDGMHDPGWGFGDCSSCHPSVDSYGFIITTETNGVITSQHINGEVDVQ